MKSYGRFQRGRYISKEKKELLWKLDKWTIEELEKIGIRVVKVEDTHQHKYTKVVLERGEKRLSVNVENPEAFYGQLMPTPLVLTITSLLMHSLFVRSLRKVREGFERIHGWNYPKVVGVDQFNEVLGRFEEVYDFFEGVRDRVIEIGVRVTGSDEFKEYIRT